jgi:hypothetical protein
LYHRGIFIRSPKFKPAKQCEFLLEFKSSKRIYKKKKENETEEKRGKLTCRSPTQPAQQANLLSIGLIPFWYITDRRGPSRKTVVFNLPMGEAARW